MADIVEQKKRGNPKLVFLDLAIDNQQIEANMPRTADNGILAFHAVADARNFTKAAAQLGIAQSTLSSRIQQLEKQAGVPLLIRTTRSVSLTEAGEQLLRLIEQDDRDLEARLDVLGPRKDAPGKPIRLAVRSHYLSTVLRPKLSEFLPQHPDLKVEFDVIVAPVDFARGGFDACVQFGDDVPKDMTAIRLSSDIRFAVVGSKSYLAAHSKPQTPWDLTAHNCINLRPSPGEDLWAWPFMKDEQEVSMSVDGQLIFNQFDPMIEAVIAGLGLAFVPEYLAVPYLTEGHIEQVLGDWCPPLASYYLYCPSSPQISPEFEMLVDALRYRE
ncbi:LysR family transcriptional regulator [Nitrospirillum viridazoti]|uniref:DNA-binding transcriptional LysR family regulator n=1 Tax=Nitrospirillum amazonense TaxID=28077 RepID=A0A560J794_9PROT|nr:LysR family transcriptional regulator [Nitrospirillum amazonense]TWB64430.1 DNA-binding transcriptional LysR family regulator [Nitrospirillum amazonense]